MILHRLAGSAAVLIALAGSARAELIRTAGEGPLTIAVNHFGFSGTYHDLYGPSGDELVSHPGGGPVAFLYVLNADATVSTYFDSKAGPYDGSDDTQVGVMNLSSSPLYSLTLGTGNVSNVFAFDGDGISAAPYNAPGNSLDSSLYGGPQTYFTHINAADTMGTANFIGGLAASGGSTYFSLENAPVMGGISPINPVIPEPSSILMIAIAAGFAGLSRRPGSRGATTSA